MGPGDFRLIAEAATLWARLFMAIFVIAVPLALWKLLELVVWVFNHVSVVVQ